MGAVCLPNCVCVSYVCVLWMYVCAKVNETGFIYVLIFICIVCKCLRVCLITAKMYAQIWLSTLAACLGVMCTDEYVCVLVHRCPKVVSLPVTRTFGVQSGGEDSQGIGKAMSFYP